MNKVEDDKIKDNLTPAAEVLPDGWVDWSSYSIW